MKRKTNKSVSSFCNYQIEQKSDIDFLFELFPDTENYIETKEALRNYLSKFFDRRIDLAKPHSLKPHFKKRILQQAIYS